jgi:hypothetical protein
VTSGGASWAEVKQTRAREHPQLHSYLRGQNSDGGSSPTLLVDEEGRVRGGTAFFDELHALVAAGSVGDLLRHEGR